MTARHFFNEQVASLLDILPLVAHYPEFALKGGTAINLFVQNMPRLSVDIDLSYLPLESREKTLETIHTLLQDLAQRIKKILPRVKIQEIKTFPEEQTKQLICQTNRVQVKVEVNTVIRGALFLPTKQILCDRTQNLFGRFITIKTLSTEDLYGGKICAALDRQHPRDLFDIYLLFKTNPIIDQNLKQAFLFYLLSHNRPMSELLNPRLKDITDLYKHNFEGMSYEPVHLDDLYQTRLDLIRAINASLTEKDKEFLISFKRGEPMWNLISAENFQAYPSIQWKLHNIKAMTPDKHKLDLEKLMDVLG
jgi:predicted nucleotidyltransferase component of viral defense system